METLPEEILIEIFQYFDVKYLHKIIANVSRRWKSLIQTPRLYNHFTLDDINDVQFLSQCPRSHCIKSIEIKYEVDLINSLFEQLSALCPRLSSLTVSKGNRLAERHIYRLMQCFPNLTHIDVFLLSYFQTQTFINAVKNVHSLVLNNHLDAITLRTIAESCKNLKAIHMYGHVQYYPLCHLHSLLASRYQILQRMSLRCCEVNNRTCELIVACRSLTHLRLYHCWLITDAGLVTLTSLKRMLSLHITGLKLVTQKGFNKFIVQLDMSILQDLNLSSTPFNNDSAKLLCSKSQFLNRLELWQCKRLTSDGVSYVICGLKGLLTLDLDMELSQEIVQLVVDKSNIKYLRLSKRDSLQVDIPVDRQLVMCDAFAYSRLCFRGNGEGYSANLIRYTLHKDCFSVEDDTTQKDVNKGKKRRLVRSYEIIHNN
ncbi:uncharacterized protein LOC143918376 [Arctopsyche grandis]|uniref:uncharacterized protein LOC143918376 n=1 Tax=Arctopsyche grandis TaxID=121162 RepID=UPI00406D9FCD